MSSRLSLPSRSSLRALVALVAAVGAVLGLSACRVQPGAAAFVGSDKISEADVVQYVGTSPSASPSTDATALSPRAQILSTLVSAQLFRQYLAKNGGVPTDAALFASRDAAFTLITGATLPTGDDFKNRLEGLGFDGDFSEAYATQVELEYEVIQRTKAASIADLSKAVTSATTAPRISPRYGKWDPSQLSLSGSTSTPSYLTLSGTSTGT